MKRHVRSQSYGFDCVFYLNADGRLSSYTFDCVHGFWQRSLHRMTLTFNPARLPA